MIQLSRATKALRSLRGALWAAVALAGAALLGLVLYGHFQQREKDARVEAVTSYIRQVNAAERGLTIQLTQAKRTYRRFGEGPAEAAAVGSELEGAVRTIGTLRTRIARLQPPPEAERLHAEIVRLIALELELAREVRALGKTLPLVTVEATRAQKAARRLLTSLRGAKTLADQAAAFNGYATSLERIAGRFDGLNESAVLTPTLQAEGKRLKKLSTLAKQTGKALEDKRAEDAQALSNRLAKAAARPTVVTKAERDAVKAYRERIRQLAEQEQTVARERERVASSLA